jgi:drug/metabolite transporter (DMT)-like permease
MPRALATGLLILTTLLWGMAFVAQKSAMENLGPLTFTAIRYGLGGLAILPLVIWEVRRNRSPVTTRDWWIIALVALSFFIAAWLQQFGLTMTTVTNAGFITSLYVLFVPFFAFAFLVQRPHPAIWVGVPLAIVGVYLLNGAKLDSFNTGDVLVLGGALGWAIQILMIGIVSRRTGLPVTISAICFAVSAVLGAAGAFLTETPTLAAIGDGWIEILYAGICSTAIAFTLQAVAQQYVPPSNAAIILSAEGLFAAIGGALLLNERLAPIGYVGAALIFAAILIVELVPALRARRAIA